MCVVLQQGGLAGANPDLRDGYLCIVSEFGLWPKSGEMAVYQAM